MLVDTHCHLGDPRFDSDRAAVLERARTHDVGHVVIVAESEPATTRAVHLARELDLSATAGVHPHEASTWSPEVAARIEATLADPVVVAVGETGLDYHYNHSPPEAQRRAFSAQLALAARRSLPVVVHARDADDDVAAMIREAESPVVLHSFSSGPTVFDAGMEIGAYFSFSGMVTFKSWTLTDCLSACPPDRLLLETDAPYLAPVPHRGKRNEPAFVRHVAARVAELRGENAEDLATRTTQNAAGCFGPRITHTFSPPA
ncbi:MAG: TatD family hydrolase [Gemmatimonadetes bacterium]|nr:TatD family hydrolase [Gemmatimonadota bacterium]